MRLIDFRIKNYRSINDSGLIEVRDRTALVGRNESGKSNILLALASLNPPDGVEALSDVKDFPRDRKRSEFSSSLSVVESQWELSDNEQADLVKILPRAKGVKKVNIGRPYAATRTVEFEKLPPFKLDTHMISKNIKLLSSHSDERVKKFLLSLPDQEDATVWAKAASSGLKTINSSNIELNGSQKAVDELTHHSEEIVQDGQNMEKAKQWILKSLPVFIYLDEYPEIPGHQDIEALSNKKRQSQPLKDSENNFLKLIKVAGLDIEELRSALSQDHEERHLLVNRAGAVVTKKLRTLWKDRQLKVRFNLDAAHFDTLISDPNNDYDVEVNLDERSRGLRWFFGFYITFAADTENGPSSNAILLLDEPGLFLHAVAQEDLLSHFASDFKNQLIYTTHSPFMIPVDDIPSVRTVNIDVGTGTAVTNNPAGDSRTLFPLQAALGYNISQTLFVGDKNLIVEGITDFWYLSAVSTHLQKINKPSLPEGLVVTPVGGANKVGYMVALLASQRLKVLVLLDAERQAEMARNEIVKAKLISDSSIVSVSEAFASEVKESDIEDLLDATVYETLVRECYEKDLKGKKLVLNNKIPRIVARMEEGLNSLGIDFNKTRPANLFLHKVADNPESVLVADSLERFSRLFSIIGERLNKLTSIKALNK